MEEIREGIGNHIDTYGELGSDVVAGMILDYLHSKGFQRRTEQTCTKCNGMRILGPLRLVCNVCDGTGKEVKIETLIGGESKAF